MIVCHCEVVSDREVVDSIRRGARTPAEVCRLTGAGRNCGTCLFSVRQLLRQQDPAGAGSSDLEVPAVAVRWEVECAAG